MKRLFTFGCSHTHHHWPTWAHILSLGFDKFYNFGKPGTGNFRILNQVIRANEHFKFTIDDNKLKQRKFIPGTGIEIRDINNVKKE